MKKIICFLLAGTIFCAASVSVERLYRNKRVILETEGVPQDSAPAADILVMNPEASAEPEKETEALVHSAGVTLEERFLPPSGYRRTEKPVGSLQGYLRQYSMKPDKSPVLLYDGREKSNQNAHAAVFSMPLTEGDLQQCADSVIRIYGEYLWYVGAYDSIAFHLTSGFYMDYPSWRSGKRLLVNGNQVSWEQKAAYDDSGENFLKYLRQVMVYAGTLSLDKECAPIDKSQIQAGDLFIRGGSPGHCVMVADVAEDEDGNRCFLLAQGYMPAQEFHILNNPLHEEDPWYYVSEFNDSLVTPEYVFGEGSLKRWREFSQ
ncbi:DUF4846 domain-containing protein [Lachnospiraceae bacterium 54-53]